MIRKPAFSLSYAHEAFRPLMEQAFATPQGIPERMRAVLDQLETSRLGDRPLGERLEAIRTLTEAEAREVQAKRSPA